MRSAVTSQRFFNKRRQISGTRSVASDPEELISFTHTKTSTVQEEDFPDMSMDDIPQQTTLTAMTSSSQTMKMTGER